MVNFQYLEATLRSMIPVLSVEGTPSDLPLRQAELVRRHKKSSLGDLADAYHQRIFQPASESSPDDALLEPYFAFSVRSERTAEEVARQKRELKSLVIERNRLIHKDLLSVDLGSTEQCEALSAKLEEQNTRLRHQLNELNAFRAGLREVAEELTRFIASEEFKKLLRSDSNDA